MSEPAVTTADQIPASPQDSPWTRLKADQWMLGLIIGGFVALVATLFTPSSIMGLPAHPLLLHMPVIFVPSLSIAAIVFAVRADWRKTYGIAYGIGAIITAFGTMVAANAGESYLHEKTGLAEGQVPPPGVAANPEFTALQHHADLGGDTKVVVAILVAAILVQILIDRGIVPKVSRIFSDSRSAASIALSGLIAALAVASTVFVLLTGHAGAKLTFGEQERGFGPGGPGTQQGGEGFGRHEFGEGR
jgi:hypothetical protein